MTSKRDVMQELVTRGVMEEVPDSSPTTWRLTSTGQTTNMLRMLTMSHVILHDEISKLHEYLDYSSELLTRIQANEPFTLDDFDLEEVADIVGEIDSLKPNHRRGDRGYL